MTAPVLPSPEDEPARTVGTSSSLTIELRAEQVRTMKAFENWRFVLQVATAGAAVGGSLVGLLALILHLGAR